jgi:hypothetical protein
MKVEARVFEIVTVFAFVVAAIYGVATHLWAHDGLEPVGTIALILTGGLAMIVGSYFQFVHRRIEERPEDRDEAEVHEGAGELGFFSPGSYWPVVVAFTAGLVGVGLAFNLMWLVTGSVVALLLAVGGLVFEYHRGPGEA